MYKHELVAQCMDQEFDWKIKSQKIAKELSVKGLSPVSDPRVTGFIFFSPTDRLITNLVLIPVKISQLTFRKFGEDLFVLGLCLDYPHSPTFFETWFNGPLSFVFNIPQLDSLSHYFDRIPSESMELVNVPLHPLYSDTPHWLIIANFMNSQIFNKRDLLKDISHLKEVAFLNSNEGFETPKQLMNGTNNSEKSNFSNNLDRLYVPTPKNLNEIVNGKYETHDTQINQHQLMHDPTFQKNYVGVTKSESKSDPTKKQTSFLPTSNLEELKAKMMNSNSRYSDPGSKGSYFG